MYHSHLLINVGNNPDRPDWNICRKWLRNLYRVHQRLCMAFPSAVPAEQEREAAYCRPFDGKQFRHLRELPSESNGCDVHQVRNGKNGFLFRIDYPVDAELRVRRPVIIVQSAGENEPDWRYAFGLDKGATDDCSPADCRRQPPIGNAGFLLAAPPQVRKVSIALDGDALVMESPKQNYRIRSGDLVRFRLRANPTRKAQDGSRNGKRKRIDPTLKDHVDWLAGKLGDAGEFPGGMVNETAHTHESIKTFVPGWAYGWRTKYEPEQPGQRMQWWSVLFEGEFRVKDPATLKTLLECGIGPGKAFGFGLLSIAPA
ncbi:MAG TPA: type I-E CRISPR-associated protein Cas6/Cse3/CasE [Planctomycetota bacterium]|nr:type I-E CRISPR-associated protein Cas6/Cse3/CasE [Planctomycetota bacterium]